MATSSSNFKAPLPSLPDEPHHPGRNFIFPKKSFGKSKPVLCSAQSQWFDTWPFLHYDEGQDVVFCHTCVKAFELNRMKSSNNAANAFVSILRCGGDIDHFNLSTIMLYIYVCHYLTPIYMIVTMLIVRLK